MTNTATYKITASGARELAEPKSWARAKLPLALAEELLDGKQHEPAALFAKLHRYDTDAKIGSKLASWVRHGWVKKTGETIVGNVSKSAGKTSTVKRSKIKRSAKPKPVEQTEAA